MKTAWTEIERVFAAALERPVPERRHHVHELCARRLDLEDEVLALLEAHELAEDLPDLPALTIEAPAGVEAEELRFGPYAAVRELGRGGTATVYLARHTEQPFERPVALKVLRWTVGEDLPARFRSEGRIQAGLEHPNVARLYEAGVSSRGEPFLAMEYVDGMPIDAYCDLQGAGLERRLELFRQVCSAVSQAHRQLVIHRDLKPGNILVTRQGVPKLLDFGIAKLLSPDPSAPKLTHPDARPMTPAYASPEQLLGRPLTTASDVYSLGVLLYRLLTGRGAHRGSLATRMEEVLGEKEPAVPSAAVRLGGAAAKDRRMLRRRLEGDLDAIVMKAMRPDPAYRYPSVDALVDDLRRFETDRPVQARRGTRRYRAGKFVRRHRAGVAVTALVTALAFGSFVALSGQAARIAEERDKAEKTAGFLVDLFKVTNRDRALGDALKAREVLDLGVRRIHLEFADDPDLQASLLDTLGLLHLQLGRLEESADLIGHGRDLRLGLFGPEHPLVASSLHHLAQVALAEGDLDQAEALADEAFEIRRRLGSKDLVAQSLELKGELALVRQDGGDTEKLLRETLAIQQSIFGKKHPKVAETLGKLGRILTLQGHLAEAEPLLRRAVAVHRDTVGERHPDFAVSVDHLATWHFERGEFEIAESYFRRTLELRQSFYPPIHPLITKSLNNIGRCLYGRREIEASEAFYRRAIAVSREVWKDGHPVVAQQLSNLAVTLHEKGELEASAAVTREAIAMAEPLLGPVHPNVLTSRHNLACLLSEIGDFGAAEDEFRRLLEDVEVLGERPEAALPRVEYARMLLSTGRPERAAALLRQALPVLRRSYDEDHFRVANARELLEQALQDQPRPPRDRPPPAPPAGGR